MEENKVKISELDDVGSSFEDCYTVVTKEINGTPTTRKANLGVLSQKMGDLSELDTTGKSSLVNAINEARQSGGGGGSTTIVDNLTSDSTTSALSAKQGKVLKGLVDAKAEDSEVVHNSGVENISGKKTFTEDITFESSITRTEDTGSVSIALTNVMSDFGLYIKNYSGYDESFEFLNYDTDELVPIFIANPSHDNHAATKEYVDNEVAGRYAKPIGGIPKTDLASAVQTSLGKADTALQSHQDISGKADKITSVNSGTAFDANKIYKLGTIAGTQVFSLNASSEAYAEYMIEFSTGDAAPSITWNMPNIKWMGGTAPTINANKSYYVSILDNLAVYGEF